MKPDEMQELLHHRLLDAAGRVVRWPQKQKQQMLVLRYLSENFSPDKMYAEREVNEILKQWHTFSDWPMLRRALVDNEIMWRDRAGTEYRIVEHALS